MISYIKELCPNKASAREFLFKAFVGLNRTVTLGGPTIIDHIQTFRKIRYINKGFCNIESYEFNKHVYIKQLQDLILSKIKKIKLYNDDIIQANYDNNTFYEMDFCGNIDTFIPHIKKYLKNTIFTFSLRTPKKYDKGMYKEYVISKFFQEREEIVLNKVECAAITTIITNKGEYQIIVYKDNGPSMINIACLP